jgi:hypothetical protein
MPSLSITFAQPLKYLPATVVAALVDKITGVALIPKTSPLQKEGKLKPPSQRGLEDF